MHAIFSTMGTILKWGTPAYCASDIPTALTAPSKVKDANGTTLVAREILSGIDTVVGLRQDVLIYQSRHTSFVEGLGTNFGPAAVIIFDAELNNVDKEALTFQCKHELCHIYYSDPLVNSSLTTATALVSAFAIPYLENLLPSWMAPATYALPYLASTMANLNMKLYFEKRADIFAAKLATPEELFGIHRFLTVLVEVQKKLHESFPKKFTEDGNRTFHPPQFLQHRLEIITGECELRKIAIPIHDPAKIEKIRQYHLKLFYKQSGQH